MYEIETLTAEEVKKAAYHFGADIVRGWMCESMSRTFGKRRKVNEEIS